MPKIKDLNNEDLKEYLAAYKYELNKDLNNPDLKFTVRAIEKALNDRVFLGKTRSSRKNKKSIFGFLKRKKK